MLLPKAHADRIAKDGEPWLRVWRQFVGLSFEDLSQRSGVSQWRLERIESGAAEPAEDEFARIAGALGVKAEQIDLERAA